MGKNISTMFLKAIKNFCSLSLQLTSFNQNSLSENKNFPCMFISSLINGSVNSQMGIMCPPGDMWHCLSKNAAVCHAHDSHPQQRSIFSKRSTKPMLRKPNLNYKTLDKSNVLLKNIH